MTRSSRRVLGRLRRSSPPSATANARRKPQRGTPPDSIGRGPLVAGPGLRLGIVVPVRDEAPYLEEWLAYHHALGVQHFFIYDNGSEDGLHEVIDRWVNHGIVTVTHWPLPGGQIDAYSHAIRFFGPSVEWLAFVDVDEFIVPLVDDDIPTLLARWPDAADVRIPRKDFGFSGHRSPPDTLTIEAYTEVADVFARDPAKPQRVKSVVRPRGVSAMGIHTATLADEPISNDGRPVPTESIGRRSREFAQVNHYYTRSFEAFEAKRVRGSATGRQDRPAVSFDLPALEVDTSAHRFIERTQATMAHMRSLDASPYRYGSELGFAQFPRFNDLGLFAEFAVANTASGEPQLRREPRTRMENLYGGIGFVGDVGELGQAPVRGGLSTSIHLGPLLDRARARMVASWAADPPTSEDLARGVVSEQGGAWVATADDGIVETSFAIRPGGARRCYAVGFLLTASQPLELEMRLTGEQRGAASQQVRVKLERATTYAGVVELDPRPRLADKATIRLLTPGAGPSIFDLFLLSYG